MGDPLNLAMHAVDQPRPAILYCEVTTPLPTHFDDPMTVTLPQWRTDVTYWSGPWPAIHGNTMPSTGAAVTLVRDSLGAHRCVWWDGPHS